MVYVGAGSLCPPAGYKTMLLNGWKYNCEMMCWMYNDIFCDLKFNDEIKKKKRG